MKFCLRCQKEKEISQFCIRSNEIDGRHRYCKDCMKSDNKSYYHQSRKNNLKAIEYYQKYREENRDYYRKESRKHYFNNKKYYFDWGSKKYHDDPLFRIRKTVNRTIHGQLTKNKIDKNKKYIKYLGCTISKYKLYLESLFTPEMSWKNYGSYWEIDHIQPLSSFNLIREEEQFEAFNWLNTQPLTVEENRRKSDKIIIKNNVL